MSIDSIHDHSDAFHTYNDQLIPPVMRTVSRLILVVIVLGTLFMVLTPWVQTTTGMGNVTALDPSDRQQEIHALVSGRIQKWHVRDGMPVKTGDPIVQIVDNDPQLIDRLNMQRDQAVSKLQAAESVVSTAEIDLERTRELFESGLTSRRDYEQSRIRVQELLAKSAQAAAELSRVEVELSRQSVQVVRAPRDGVILRVNAGDSSTFIKTGDLVATFVPDNVERAVEIFIPGRDIALVQPGAQVRLQFEGWPAVQFSGWPSVAIGTFAARVVAVDPSAQLNGQFRILVAEDSESDEPWPEERFVRFGAKARGWVLLGTTNVGYEIWRQLNSFPPNLPEQSTP